MIQDRQHTLARERWEALWSRFGVSPPPESIFREVAAAYGGDDRHYHGLAHILDCLDVLERFEHLAEKPAEVAAALWFHDVVYDPHRDDNEEASACWAARVLDAAGVGRDSVERVQRMILATRHADSPHTRDEALLLDIDLSILGRDPHAFQRYQEQIRREYAWVPNDAFSRARASILARFLERDAIFRTRELAEVYEKQARTNIDSALRDGAA